MEKQRAEASAHFAFKSQLPLSSRPWSLLLPRRTNQLSIHFPRGGLVHVKTALSEGSSLGGRAQASSQVISTLENLLLTWVPMQSPVNCPPSAICLP